MHWWNDHISALRSVLQKKRRISQRGYRRPDSAELVAEYKKARRELNKAIEVRKRRCWKELVEEVGKDQWGRPYKVVIAHLKSQYAVTYKSKTPTEDRDCAVPTATSI
ncbi:hypothetical protein EVAR_90957_1 [Eumeta japonica]|uniref:Retrovirus-related Pol polyprotein from type-1 retrotransposable element R1 n=1 Tax=Eumeta variegata TaxID=151549 RepID=A0A4C1ZEB9_EUMVA|nr:hypothetical protein EVAR_90957_1 [Eumeta japonica]